MPQDGEAIQVRHVQVEQDQIRLKLGANRTCFAGVGCAPDVPQTIGFKNIFEQPDIRFVVVDDQNAAAAEIGFGHYFRANRVSQDIRQKFKNRLVSQMAFSHKQLSRMARSLPTSSGLCAGLLRLLSLAGPLARVLRVR